jgi:hypothetical protein
MQCPLILLVHLGRTEGKAFFFKVFATVYYDIDKGSSYISDEEWILLFLSKQLHAIYYLLSICGTEHSFVRFLRDVLDEFISSFS